MLYITLDNQHEQHNPTRTVENVVFASPAEPDEHINALGEMIALGIDNEARFTLNHTVLTPHTNEELAKALAHIAKQLHATGNTPEHTRLRPFFVEDITDGMVIARTYPLNAKTDEEHAEFARMVDTLNAHIEELYAAIELYGENVVIISDDDNDDALANNE